MAAAHKNEYMDLVTKYQMTKHLDMSESLLSTAQMSATLLSAERFDCQTKRNFSL